MWESWGNTSDPTAVPPDFRFDGAQYEAELARASADRSGEEPVDTVARLLEQAPADSGWFERWGCVLTSVSPRREEPGLPGGITGPPGVDVHVHQVREHGERTEPYRYGSFVTPEQSVEEQVRRLTVCMWADDPRESAKMYR